MLDAVVTNGVFAVALFYFMIVVVVNNPISIFC